MAATYTLEQFCDEMEVLVAQKGDLTRFLKEAQDILKRLLANREFTNRVLEQMVQDDAFTKSSISTIDRHDILLHRSPKGSFSMRMFVWAPGSKHHIHDHGSWGIVGSFVNQTEEISYRRIDDGSREGYAEIEERSRRVLSPGDTTSVLPLNGGIHWTGSASDETGLTVHVYGRPMRKGFVQCFDLENNSIYYLITPKVEKRLYAVRALGAIGGNDALNTLQHSFCDQNPLVRWESVLSMKQIDTEAGSNLMQAALEDEDEWVQEKARAALRM
ncbi:MAG: HEAT repeat domain-containing protein [Chloroflexota bacterium]|nr:HEAT repeat domain-containing protein [Chloroflexota bacterium]